ncbi:MAG: right-handed parallel beta-helix repeat-containing protein [Lentisphaeria bacterium]|nr:right-handed parallel beta-helix repeat-containing protein [Lentisphaeria bacterium]
MAASVASAAIYYVDAEHGDDKAAGTTPPTAWRSIARVNAQSFKPGDSILFKRGNVFRGGTLQLASGEPGKPVTYSAYGDGHKPIIQPSLDFNDSTKWEACGENLWRTKTRETHSIKENGRVVDLQMSNWTVYVEKPAVATCSSIAHDSRKTYTIHYAKQGERETNVQLLGPTLEEGNAHYVFKYRIRSDKPFKMSVFRIMQSRTPWTMFAIEHGKDVNVTSQWQEMECFLYNSALWREGTPIRLNNFLGKTVPDGSVVEFEPISLQEVEFKGMKPLLSDVGNIIFNHGEACGWKRWNIEQLKEEKDYFHDTREGVLYMRHVGNPGGAYKSLEFAYKTHCVSHGGTHDAVVDGLWCRYAGGHGFSGGNTHRVTIRNCDICYIGGSVLYDTTRYGNGVEFWCEAQDCLVENNHIWQCYDVAITNQGNAPNQVQRNLIYRNNLLRNCEQHYEYWRSPESALTENIQFIHNTCLNAGQVWAHWQRPNKHSCHLLAYHVTAPTRNIVIRNNVFCNAIEALILHHADLRNVIDCDHNLWWQDKPDSMLVRIFNAKYGLKFDEFAKWQSDDKKDIHSIIGKPMFINADFDHPQEADFHLAPNSPGAQTADDGGPVGIR